MTSYSSLLFIYGFLPVSLAIYRITPERFRNMALFIMSAVFCALKSLRFLGLMIVYTFINYLAGLFIYKFRNRKRLSAIPLAIGVCSDLVIFLGFRTELISIFNKIFGFPEGFFPVGISFAFLTGVGYLSDIYNRRIRAEFDILKFYLYMMMFPKMIMGSWVQYNTFRRMLDKRKFTMGNVGRGLTVFVRGLAKKVIAGDTMYMMYMSVRGMDIWKMSAVSAWLGATACMLSFYFTVSGIADMGKGVGYCFGCRLPDSFSYPLFSNKIKDFAAGWHVQVVYWFRRYLLKPLCSFGKSTIYRKVIFISVWCVLGMWYRPDVRGLIFGGIIGSAVVAEKYIRRLKFLKVTGIIYTYVITVTAMVFISGESVPEAFNYLLVMFGGNGSFADTTTLYLMKYYIILLLICIYSATSLFRNTIIRSGNNIIRYAVAVLTPVVNVLMLLICTAMISYNGSSENLIMLL